MIPKLRIFIKRIKKIAQVTLIDFEDNYLTCEIEIDDGIYQEFELSFAELLFDEAHLMQYCGLHDRDGNEIFDGDIVQFVATKHLVVIKNRGIKGFVGIILSDNTETYFAEGADEDLEKFTKTVRIVGNIYENPELLEVPHDQ